MWSGHITKSATESWDFWSILPELLSTCSAWLSCLCLIPTAGGERVNWNGLSMKSGASCNTKHPFLPVSVVHVPRSGPPSNTVPAALGNGRGEGAEALMCWDLSGAPVGRITASSAETRQAVSNSELWGSSTRATELNRGAWQCSSRSSLVRGIRQGFGLGCWQKVPFSLQMSNSKFHWSQ